MTLPHNIEAEQAVIGGLMLDPKWHQSVVANVQVDDFYRRDHKIIFKAINELAAQDKPFDAVTLGIWCTWSLKSCWRLRSLIGVGSS